MQAQNLDEAWIKTVREAAMSSAYADELRQMIVDLVAINTAADADLSATQARERQLFDWITQRVGQIAGSRAKVEFQPLRADIAQDPAYSLPGYAADAQENIPPAEVVYRGRGNLLIHVAGERADQPPAMILHAHVDVVRPWFAPRVEGQRIFGRGACDNKAQVAVALALLKLLLEAEAKSGRRIARGFVIQLVIDEEIGGNGSLSAVKDKRFSNLPVLMLESSDLVPYCAHRGAVYYRCKLTRGKQPQAVPAEMFPLVVRELEAEGQKIKNETRLDLFTPGHVQTNHGIVGKFGVHPGNVCDHVQVEIIVESKANPERVAMKIIEFMEQALAEYIRIYGDKRRQLDPATGKPKVERHFELKITPHPTSQNFHVDIWGKSGHMAAVADCDSAITKASFLLAGLLRMVPAFPNVKATGRLVGAQVEDEVILEGGQGFTPAHAMADVQARLIAAAKRGMAAYSRIRGIEVDEDMMQLSFDRLHNDAYADSPDCAPMEALQKAFAAMGKQWPTPVAWTTSCDARLYHQAGHATAIWGAGKLDAAHSEREYVDLGEVQEALAIATMATLSLLST